MARYTLLERALHWVALPSPRLGETLFNLDAQFSALNSKVENPVYVTGLARSGTTAITRALHETGEFASLTYSDMPFVMAPNLWAKIVKLNKASLVTESRAHGDGIDHNYLSPEGLEEVFWRVFIGDIYIHADHLAVHKLDEKLVKLLTRYQQMVCTRYGKARYLAKNNNSILRLESLAEYFPDTRFLVLFRHPMRQAESLLRQHLRFSDQDAFSNKYFEWLVHHEFGSNHRAFGFERSEKPQFDQLEPKSIDYWLRAWVDAYGFILGVANRYRDNVRMVSFDRLCGEKGYWDEICNFVKAGKKVPSPFWEKKSEDLSALGQGSAEMKVFKMLLDLS